MGDREARENKYWFDKRTPVQREVPTDDARKNKGIPHYERLFADHSKNMQKLQQMIEHRKAIETRELDAALDKLHRDVLGPDEDPKEVIEEMVHRLYSEHRKRARKLEKARKNFV